LLTEENRPSSTCDTSRWGRSCLLTDGCTFRSPPLGRGRGGWPLRVQGWRPSGAMGGCCRCDGARGGLDGVGGSVCCGHGA
jgi:hypothetical protein